MESFANVKTAHDRSANIILLFTPWATFELPNGNPDHQRKTGNTTREKIL
jgi:hypothetical protein